MKRFNTSAKVSGGVLTAVLVLGTPVHAITANQPSLLETNDPQAQTVIEEWHWRNMDI
ncbi:MAG: hypothetical protein AAGA83_20625 [Cyanobacteria bacterium P01_F01_bin.116]